MMQNLQMLDYVAVGVYMLLMAFVGVLFGYLVKDSGSYFKGGGAIPWVMTAITNFMGLFSSALQGKPQPPDRRERKSIVR